MVQNREWITYVVGSAGASAAVAALVEGILVGPSGEKVFLVVAEMHFETRAALKHDFAIFAKVTTSCGGLGMTGVVVVDLLVGKGDGGVGVEELVG